MYSKLTMQERLKDLRVCQAKLTLEQLAAETGLSRSSLGRYENEENVEISPYALVKLAQFYNVSTDYILGLTENKNHPNTALSELHLSDEAIDILKDGKFNTRLLSEIICHEDFLQLMVDAEVHVDKIAESHFRDMNLFLETVRNEIIEKYHPDKHELPMRTLKLAQSSQDEFLKNIIHEDLNRILEDIRKAHASSAETAEPQTEAEATPERVKEMLREALDYEGTSDEKRAFLVCRTLDINYAMLSDDEKKYLAAVCKKSPILRDVMSQRGKTGPRRRG